MAASALMPARNSSVFFTGLPSLAARSFSSSNTAYSAFGMVMLSRTIFGFFALAGLGAATGLAGLDSGIFLAPTVDFVTRLWAGFTADLEAVAAFLAPDAVTVFIILTAFTLRDFATTGAALGAVGESFTITSVMNQFQNKTE